MVRLRFATLSIPTAVAVGAAALLAEAANGDDTDLEVVATILGESVYRDDLHDRDEPGSLLRLALERLRSPFLEERGLRATDADIAEYCLEADVTLDPDSERIEDLRQAIAWLIELWRFDRAVHEQHGGLVIGELANESPGSVPIQRPMGAYRAFLEDCERKGQFAILADDLLPSFWGQFNPGPYDTVVPPEQVDFSRPFPPWFLLGPDVTVRPIRSKPAQARRHMRHNILMACWDFRRHHQRQPDSLEELTQPSVKNFDEPYVQPEDLIDPWGNAYGYERLTETTFAMSSFGADGTPGGEGEDADIRLGESGEPMNDG